MDITSKYFGYLEDFIDVTMTKGCNALIVKGKSGIGKTFNTLKILKNKNIKFMLVGGNLTPLELYKKLYAVQKGDYDVVVFDDLLSILKSDKSIVLLMASFWEQNNKRIVSWVSSTSLLEGYPKKFQFTKRCILLLNKIPKTDIIESLLTRCMVYEIDFDRDTILNIMKDLANTKNEKEVVAFLERNVIKADKLNLRLMREVTSLRNTKKNWKELALSLLKTNKKIIRLVALVDSCADINEARDKWCEEYSHSPNYFNKLKRRVI